MWCITAKGTLLPLLQVGYEWGGGAYYSAISAQQSFQVKWLNMIGCKL